jgi:hypothetical protein
MTDEISIEELTEMLFVVPYPPNERPDPIGSSFEGLEKRIGRLIDYLWDNQHVLDNPRNLHPIWIVSLRITVLYLNMSNGFDGCGGEFIKNSFKEGSFIKKYQDSKGRSRLERASRLLSRTVVLLRKLGFKSQLISIGGDGAYYGTCEETLNILMKLKKAK